MSKTYTFILVVIAVFLLVVKGISFKTSSGGSTTHTSSSGATHGGGGGRF